MDSNQQPVNQASLDISSALRIISEKALSYFTQEFSIVVQSTILHPTPITQLQLKYITVFINLELPQPIMFALSMDLPLIERLCRTYTEELSINENEIDLYLEETASDIVNIIIGNATADLGIPGLIIPISVPIVITEAKKISQPKKGSFLVSDSETDCGNFTIYCIGQNL